MYNALVAADAGLTLTGGMPLTATLEIGPALMAEPKTKTVRCMADITAMLDVIKAAASIEGRRFSSVEFLDSLIRPAVSAEYKKALAVLRKQKPE